jgi:uncharacterized protein YjbI with pentapeptide repeats
MADPEQLAILRQGPTAWNNWRSEHGIHQPDLSGANFRDFYHGEGSLGVNLQGANLSEADLSRAQLPRAELQWSNLWGATLARADLHEARFMAATLNNADFSHADLHDALINDARAPYATFNDCNLTGAYLWGTDFREADFHAADLTGADLRNCQLARAKFRGATLVGCKVFGVAAWDLELEGADQRDLNVQRTDAPPVLVYDLEVAQFVYLMLDNKRLRRIIDTITSKVVLILGRFTPERKAVLDALREYLSANDYVPIVFDFPVPESRDTSEVVTLLARMARFIIADLTSPSSIPQELEAIVRDLAVPVKPLIEGDAPYSTFKSYWKYDWVLPVHRYGSLDDLLDSVGKDVVEPAIAKALELDRKRKEALES